MPIGLTADRRNYSEIAGIPATNKKMNEAGGVPPASE